MSNRPAVIAVLRNGGADVIVGVKHTFKKVKGHGHHIEHYLRDLRGFWLLGGEIPMVRVKLGTHDVTLLNS